MLSDPCCVICITLALPPSFENLTLLPLMLHVSSPTSLDLSVPHADLPSTIKGAATGDWNAGGESAAAGDWNGGGDVTTNGNGHDGDDHGATNGAVAVTGGQDHSDIVCRK